MTLLALDILNVGRWGEGGQGISPQFSDGEDAKWRMRVDNGLEVDVVRREPVSRPNSLPTGIWQRII